MQGEYYMRNRLKVPALCILQSLTFTGDGVAAQRGIEIVPIEVSEVVSGGTWTDGPASGSFRTVTVQVPGETDVAQVFLQWIGSRSPVEPIELLMSVPVSEFNGLKLPSASVTIDAETEGEVRIDIAGQPSEAQQSVIVVLVATTPGHYSVVPQPGAATQR